VRRIPPFARGLGVIALIALAVVLLNQQTSLTTASTLVRFGFYLANVSGRGFGVGKVAFLTVTKGNVTQLMEKGFVWLRGNRADGDLPATLRVTLGVAVQVLKWDSLDFQRGKCRLLVPFGKRGGLVFGPLRLRQDKPVGFVSKMREGKFLVLVGAVIFFDRLGSRASQRHTER